MTATAPTGARPRRGRPRHHESPRSRVRTRREADGHAREAVGPPAGTQLTSVIEVDLTGDAPETVLATVATAAVRAGVRHPAVLGRVDADGTVVRSAAVHLGVLAEDETAVVVVEDAQDLTAAALASRITDGRHSDVRCTLGVIDTGSRAVLMHTPALGQDRTAVLGIGAVVRRPVVMQSDAGEVIVVRAMAHLSLSYDPRVSGGADAARFLSVVRQRVEEGSG